jgi:hypothetical protein
MEPEGSIPCSQEPYRIGLAFIYIAFLREKLFAVRTDKMYEETSRRTWFGVLNLKADAAHSYDFLIS